MPLPDLMDVCVALTRRGAYQGTRVAAEHLGNTSPDPERPWAVRELDGGPRRIVVLAPDAFEAAAALRRCETYPDDYLPDPEYPEPRTIPTDAEAAERDFVERVYYDHRYTFGDAWFAAYTARWGR